MSIEIREARKTDADLWDSIVNENPTGSTFHFFDWIHITEKHTNSRLYPLFVYEGSEVIGLLPLFFQKRQGISLVFSPPPQSGLLALGPVLHHFESLKQQKQEQLHTKFWSAIDTFIRTDLKADYVRIALPCGYTDPRPLHWSGYSTELAFDYSVDLTVSPDTLWSQLSSDDRKKIKKAKSLDFTIQKGERKELATIHSLMQKRYEDQHKTMTISLPHLLELYDRYPDLFVVFTGAYENQIVTGDNHVISKNSIIAWIDNPKSSIKLALPPNDLVRWQSIQYACERGFSQYIQMGAAGNVVRHTHFSKFNPRLQIRYYAHKQSFVAGCLEKTYRNIVKPVKDRLL
jgi:CelD/BcsL family acetyltransferase involved in cellulose biosynthesis